MSGPLTDDRLEAVYLDDLRPNPWLLVNMVATVDGATTVDGRSSSIGDRQDGVVFRALRATSDVILVAAATVRAEQYSAPALPQHLVERRLALGKPANPAVAIVSRSLDIDIDRFGDSPPLVVTAASSSERRRRALSGRADVVVAGEENVEPTEALDELRRRGFGVVLSEGGPSLNGQLAAAGLIDEWCLTVAPLVVSGDSPRVARGEPIPGGLQMRLDRAIQGDTSLFTRWLAVEAVGR